MQATDEQRLASKAAGIAQTVHKSKSDRERFLALPGLATRPAGVNDYHKATRPMLLLRTAGLARIRHWSY